jgi:phosphatidylglycerol:prolipoprotein diacylglycerol transferase
MNSLHASPYGWPMLAGIFVSVIFWSRLARRDERLVLIYIAALAGAFLGAKIVYLLAEGWLHWHDANRWLILGTGKSITGALLGGYAGVELAKKLAGYRGVTGDWFALIAPVGIIIGRLGCLLHGCCLGSVCSPAWYTIDDAAGAPRWPAVPLEMLFNVVAIAAVLVLRHRYLLPGQHFHLYLIGYGLFRFAHEFWRATPKILGALSGYQLAALAVLALGLIGFVERRRKQHAHEYYVLPAQKLKNRSVSENG